MIYYKKKKLLKKIAGIISERCYKEKVFNLSFFLGFFSFVSILLLTAYIVYLFLLPKYLDESNFEKLINNFILKNTKLTLDITEFQVSPNYKFDINLKAKHFKLLYPDKSQFILVDKPTINVGLLSLTRGFIDFNKIKANNVVINTNFTKKQVYDCFEYFNFNTNYNFKFKIRNVNLDIDKLTLNIFDKNINKLFFLKSNNLKVTSLESKKLLAISTFGLISSRNHKISDYKLKLLLKISPDSVVKFKDKIVTLNYNPLFYADLHKFYSESEIDLKINPQDNKNNISGFVSLKNYHFLFNNFQMPKNNLLLNFKNNKIYTNCDFKFIKNQEIKIIANMSLNRHKFIEAKLNSNEINLFDLKEMFDIAQKIFNFKLNIDTFDFSGLAKINLYLKSNFKTIYSSGKMQIIEAKILDKKTGLVLKNINSNINFDNNEINILNASALINGSKFNLVGKIDAKTNLNLKVNSDTINIVQVLNLVKSLSISKKILPMLQDYTFKSGNLKINSEILGTFEKPVIKSKSVLTNLNVYLEKYKIGLEVPKFETKLLENDVLIPNTLIKIDSIPVFVEGVVKNYKTNQAEADILVKSNLDNFPILINDQKLKINANLNIKQNQINITKGNLSNSIQFFGDINNVLKEPVLNLKLNLNNKTKISCENISFFALGNMSILGALKKPEVVAKFDLHNIKLPISNLTISNGFLNIQNSKFYFEFTQAVLYEIVLNSISFKADMTNDLFNISDFYAQTLNGELYGKMQYNLIDKYLNSELSLNEINIRMLPNKLKEQFVASSGKLNAEIDSKINFSKNNVLDALFAKIDFSIKNGELSQFAKLERFLQAGNILSQSFLKLNLNSALSALTKQNTGDFREIKGEVNIKNGIADILNVTSRGSNMSLHLEGNYNLITQYLDLKVLGRIPNSVVNTMGNFAKDMQNVPTSSLERKLTISISENEINKIPDLAYDSFSNTREFVVIIDGLAKSLNSIRDFKWVVNE